MIKTGYIFSIGFAIAWLIICLFDSGQSELDQVHNNLTLAIWTAMILIMGGLKELKDK